MSTTDQSTRVELDDWPAVGRAVREWHASGEASGKAWVMDHRLGPRARIPIGVVLHRTGQGPAPCRTRDIGADGVFLAVDPAAIGLGTGTPVKLELSLPGQRASARGVVVHREPGGVGIMFGSLDRDGREALEALLARHWRQRAVAA